MTEQDRVVQGQETHELLPNYRVSGRRIGAALIDFIAIVGLFTAQSFALGNVPSGLIGYIIVFGALFFCIWGYYVILEGMTSTTLGKMIMGLQVVKADGERCAWGSVLIRNTLRIVDGLPFLYLIGIICMAFTRKKQRLGDLAAGTVVVRAASLAQILPNEVDSTSVSLAEPVVQVQARWRASGIVRMAFACFVLTAVFGISAFAVRAMALSSVDVSEAAQHFNAGLELRKKGLFDEAIAEYDQAIRLDPQHVSPYMNRGEAYLELGKPERAIQDFEEAIRLDPQFAAAYYNRGNAYSGLGQRQRAIKDYEEAIRLDPQMAAAYNNRGLAYNNLGQYQRAIEDLDEAIRLDPQHVNAYGNRGRAYLEIGKPERAIKDYDEAIRLNPQVAVAYANRALSYTLLGKDKEARQDAARAVELGIDRAELETAIARIKAQH